MDDEYTPRLRGILYSGLLMIRIEPGADSKPAYIWFPPTWTWRRRSLVAFWARGAQIIENHQSHIRMIMDDPEKSRVADGNFRPCFVSKKRIISTHERVRV